MPYVTILDFVLFEMSPRIQVKYNKQNANTKLHKNWNHLLRSFLLSLSLSIILT